MFLRKSLFLGISLGGLIAFATWSALSFARAADDDKPPAKVDPELAAQVKQLFRSRCLECHGGTSTRGGVRILERDQLLKKKKVVANKPDDSPLYQVISATDETVMPPTGRPVLSPQDITLVRKWIVAGAPAFPADVAPPAEKEKEASFKTVAGIDHVLKSILAHVRSQNRQDRRYMRYFSINHIATGGATAADLDVQREALVKAINHLSWQKRIVPLISIDEPNNTVFAVDLRKLGWNLQPYQRWVGMRAVGKSDINLWDLALLEYPFGIFYESSETFDHLLEEYVEPAGMVRPIPYVRADWFVSVVTQPTLYEDFLTLPFSLAELEKHLGVDSRKNLEDYEAKRAGMTVSGVSRNNRVVERHPSKYGAFWKSFDFRSSKGRENMFKDPIDFREAGGEFIFNLPNGLQGYFVADGKGNRIEFAPTDIVTDKFAEDKTVRNGLACIRCHDQGMKTFLDTVRPALDKLPGSPGFDKQFALKLYVPQKEMDALVKEDQERFQIAMKRTLGKDQKREPLIPVTRRYLDDPISLITAAGELGQPDGTGLSPLFRLPRFSALGLMPLASGGVVRRDSWEEYIDQMVRLLGLGIPIVPIDGVSRRDFTGEGALEVDLKTNKRGNVFEPGEQAVISVTNRSDKPLYIELVGTSTQGRKVLLTPGSTVLKVGETYRYPPEGGLKVAGGIGREQISLLASVDAIPTAEVLRGKGVTDRVVHAYYSVNLKGKRTKLEYDPVRVVKKTIEIETR